MISCCSRWRSGSRTSCCTASRPSGASWTPSASSRYNSDVASKPVEQLESVVIRFAGDSGDGMQLTAAGSPRRRRCSATTSPPTRISRPRSAPRRARSRRLRLPAPLRRPRHPHARRRAERPRRDEPGGPEDEPQGPAAERDPRRRQGTRSPTATCRRPAMRATRSRTARWTSTSPPDPADLDDDRGAEGHRRDHEARGRALEEHVRARTDVVALRPPDRGDDRLPAAKVREAARDRRGERQGIPDGLCVRRDDRVVRGAVRGQARRAEAGPLSQHHRQPGACVRADRGVREVRPAALPRRVPDHARVSGARRARTAQELRRAHVPG